MKKTFNIILILVIAAGLILLKLFFFPSGGGADQKGAQQNGKSQTSLVAGYIVKQEALSNRIYVTGTILANQEVTLMPERAGKVTSVFFKEGTKINKGDLLLKINDAALQAQLKKLKLQEQLSSEIEGRQKQLLAINGISQQEYNTTLSQLNSVKADIELLQSQIAESEIRAPFSGTIGLSAITEGSYITPATPVVSIQQTDPVKIDFYIPEKYVNIVKPGDSLSFTLENIDERQYAVVSAIEPKVDISTRTLQLHALAPNKKGIIFPGSFAQVELALSKNEKAIMIPTEAVIPILKGQKVYVSKNGKAEETKVTIGVRDAAKVQVISGLSPGDTVIVSGLMQLKKGNTLKFTSVK